MKILFLGASNFQLAAIQYAKKEGHYVVTCDNAPDNIGHKIADEYHNVSTTDMKGVLALARGRKVDAVIAYASDPAAPVAAYVGNELGLVSNPYEAVLTLQRKDLFRKFQKKHGFNHPEFHISGVLFDTAQYKFIHENFPVVIKPVDSSGSKGVTVVRNAREVEAAIDLALSFSPAKMIITEKYVEKDGYQIAGDGFLVEGELVFRCFANEHFGGSPVPMGESFPCVLSEEMQKKVHAEIQRMINLLGMKYGALNFDIRIKGDDIYLMEIGPRAGGNLIPEAIKYATGVDLIKCTVEQSLYYNCADLQMKPVNGFWSTYIVHSQKSGVFLGMTIDKEVRDNIVERRMFVKAGDVVKAFTGSHCTLGAMILKFGNQDEMLRKMDRMYDHIKVGVE